ncbi:MAG: right-handed parallel beta-helix repeat-containing protein, partial [Candidatus Heimdallarchaeota archaeon]|nr:right-handed parallel beta-helix repeat-containing protein [Candidatus Heimdallarchaeota archaeon]MCK5048832.1 right-handed parallel beta-helix repeat-containing protein [Candidatus Heimdallarchaeota archaeon]
NNCSLNQYGMYFDTVINASIQENTCNNNENYGILVRYSSEINLIDNNCSNNVGYGIEVYETDNSILRNNNLRNNSDGVRISYSSNCEISSNFIVDNRMRGIIIIGSDTYNIRIYENYILYNNKNYFDYHPYYFEENDYYQPTHSIQVYSDSESDTFYNSTTGRGNIWSDFKWSYTGSEWSPEYYLIDINKDQFDQYPIFGEDLDSNELPDWWEEYWGITDPWEDEDRDDLPNIEEFYYLTNPWSDDTDNDDMPDYYEVMNKLNPLYHDDKYWDLDGDDLPNIQEFYHATDPWDKDTDNDGWTDKEEIDAGTNPLNADDHPIDWFLWGLIGGGAFLVLPPLLFMRIKKIRSFFKKRKEGAESKREEERLKELKQVKERLTAISNTINQLTEKLDKYMTDLSSVAISPDNCSVEALEKTLNPLNNGLTRFEEEFTRMEIPEITDKWLLKEVDLQHKQVSVEYKELEQRVNDLRIVFTNLSMALATEALRLRREYALTKILPKLVRMSLEDFAKRLEFKSSQVLQDWLFDLSADYPLLIDGSDIVVDREKLDSSEISDVIDQMLNKFTAMEKDQSGKME